MASVRRIVAGGFGRIGHGFLRLATLVRDQRVPLPVRPTYPNPRFDPERHAARVQHFHGNNLYHHLLDFDLTEASTVFDLGGYEGDFASNMFCRYLSTVHVFEPVPAYCVQIRQRFVRNPRVHVHEVGLAGATRDAVLYPAQAGTSMFVDRMGAGDTVTIRLVRADDYIRELGVTGIDLMKINIEGGEYELLEHLLDTGWAERIRNVLVQFHEEVVPDAPERMRAIHERLARTHRATFQYEFVWENWELK
jgi:FkbM family methyltransferase